MDFLDNDNNDNKELMQIFQTESEEIVDRVFNSLYALEKTPANKELINSVYRDLHSLKGAVRMIGYNNIQMIIHKMEDIFDAVKDDKIKLEYRYISLMSKSLELVSGYIQESIKNGREITDENYKSIMENLGFITDVEINDTVSAPSASQKPSQGVNIPGLEIPGLDIPGLDIPGIDISEFNIPSFDKAMSIEIENQNHIC